MWIFISEYVGSVGIIRFFDVVTFYIYIWDKLSIYVKKSSFIVLLIKFCMFCGVL